MSKRQKSIDTAGVKIIAHNKKARRDFELLDSFEAGIVLLGTEVKSLREGKIILRESYARIEAGEVFLYNAHISHYDGGNRNNHDPERPRKLLLHQWEIRRLQEKTEQGGLTLIPTKVYFKRGMAKVELALARGKREFDKRRDIARRDAQRAVDRALSERQ